MRLLIHTSMRTVSAAFHFHESLNLIVVTVATNHSNRRTTKLPIILGTKGTEYVVKSKGQWTETRLSRAHQIL